MAVVLITGGAGFIGSALTLRWAREHPSDRVVVLDALTYAGNRISLSSLPEGERFRMVEADIRDEKAVEAVWVDEKPTLVLHLAAESHVDRSILGPMAFTDTNVRGTHVLLEAARRHKTPRFVHISTDEVYGPTPEPGRFDEEAPFRPSSPYAASKAAADLLAQSYVKTYGMDLVITRASNNYGPRQTPEKLIPLMITRARADEQLPVYGDGQHKRDWIYVEDHARGIEAAALKGKAGRAYNLGAGEERTNITIVKTILGHMGKPDTLIRYVTDRPAHDRRYALEVSRARDELGFRAETSLEAGLRDTVKWYVDNGAWVEHVKARQGEFGSSWYADRLKGASTQEKPVTLAGH
ncbi:MAG: dTDP-glucose 4,6-dehydratase [Deltaproteobacteria bacterium]|nr:dTDP-glucose 4,6-dehydratase [Deltaproteobacteria bacterium]